MPNAYYLRVGELACGIHWGRASGSRYNSLPARDDPQRVICEWEPVCSAEYASTHEQYIWIPQDQESPVHAASILVPIQTANSNCGVHTRRGIVTRGKLWRIVSAAMRTSLEAIM
jgi:hypothetical protein